MFRVGAKTLVGSGKLKHIILFFCLSMKECINFPYSFFIQLQPERDPFLCTCGPCKRFWRDTFSESGDVLKEPTVCRSRDTAVLSAQSKVVRVGDRVIVQGRYPGLYIENIPFQLPVYAFCILHSCLKLRLSDQFNHF